MQLEIRNAVERDRLLYNTIGFVAGCLIAILFFRRVSFMIIAAGPPLIAILFALGALGWMDFRLNMFLNVMTPLIMVISFSDSMQLTFAARDRLIRGERKVQAFRNAIIVVGPACVLTHATAALSFGALTFTNSELIRTFGEAGLISTVIALVTVLTLAPLLGILLIRRQCPDRRASARGRDTGVQALRSFCGWVASRMVTSSGALQRCRARGRARASRPSTGTSSRATGWPTKCPTKSRPCRPPASSTTNCRGPSRSTSTSSSRRAPTSIRPETLDVIAQVHGLVEKQAGVGNVWSIETLRRWLAEKAHKTDVGTLKEYLRISAGASDAAISSPKDHDAVLVSGRIPDKDFEPAAARRQQPRCGARPDPRAVTPAMTSP